MGQRRSRLIFSLKMMIPSTNIHNDCSKGLKCIFRCNFYIFLQSKLVQIQQSLCNIGFAYFIFIEAHWMRTKSSLEFSFAGTAIQNRTQFKRGFIHISSHIINILSFSARMADFKSRYKCQTRRKRGFEWNIVGECYEKALSGTFCTVVSDSKRWCRWN